MSNLIIGGSLLFSEPDCPTREGEVVNTLEDIYNIPSPRVGMRVFVKDTKKSYIVTKLKEEEINGVLVPNAKVDEFELWDMKATEEEMLKRIQGTSEESNPHTDGFKFLGHFTSADALSEALDNLKYNSSENGQNRGYFRFTYLLSQAEVVNYLIGVNKVIQVIRGNFTVEDGKIKYVEGFGVVVRSYTHNKGWSDWSIVIDSDTISNIENSIEDKVNSAIAGLIDTAPEDLDTLKEIADWIATHKEGAADMVANISKNTTDIANEIIRAKAAEKTLSERIDNIPTGGGGGTGEIADGSVTEQKLSSSVSDKLNTAYNKANLADILFVNDGITFIQGALENTGEIYQGTNFRATSMPIITNGEKITVSGGYIITKYVLYWDNEAADYSSVDDISLNTFDGAGVENTYIRIEVRKTDNTAISEDELTGIIKSFIRKPIAWSASCNMNNFVCAGRYVISGSREANAQDNMPILNGGKVEARLEVLENENTVVQILTLLNVGGGDGNIYTRTRQDNTWGQWGKLQTNIEVGVINQQQMDALIDNGIYSGILSTTGETFVIICINNYAIAQQVGVHHISHLKYSLVVGTAEVKIEKRTRDAYGFWTEWQGIGGGSTLSEATKVTWDANSNMNDFKTAGVYDIYGERTRQDDNLPILNASSGHSIAARLTVVASTLQPANNEICITQFLQLSNRIGGDGATYVRTYNENNNGINGWSAWQKQMGMVETLINGDDVTVDENIFSTYSNKIGNGLNGMTDNGMYSGIYIDNLKYTGTQQIYYLSEQPTFIETFVLVVINDYAASGKLNLPRHITQLKYAVDAITGKSTVKKRVGTGNDDISWSDWTDIGGKNSNEIELDIDIIHTANSQGYKINTLISQGLIKENVTYVLNFQNGYWGSLKTFFSSKPINTYFEGGKNITTESELKIIYRNHYDDPVLWIEGYSAKGDYYIISIKNPHEATEVIKVSADMTEL